MNRVPSAPSQRQDFQRGPPPAANDSVNRQIQWEYFVNSDKSASPVFNELCRGLAQVIRRLEPRSNHRDLSPPQLCNFYHSCGANYDGVFKNTGEHGMSFIYRTLGCYHSYQPTKNAFEPPSIPCLTEDGFVRWQTLQLLLNSDEHVGVIQRAVERYDVPRRDGTFFPKSIPRQCFPAQNDADMEKWYRFVTSQMDEDYTRRIKYSPNISPAPDAARPEGYFNPLHGRKASAPRRRDHLSEDDIAKREAYKRRSSVPDIISPGGTIYNEQSPRNYSRSRSAARPDSRGQKYSSRQSGMYSPATRHAPLPYSPSSQRSHDSSLSQDRRNRDRQSDSRHSRNVSSGSRTESAEDASSEESYRDRKYRTSDEDSNKRRSRWGASLMPSFFLSKSQRRHSSDGRVPTIADGRKSPRRQDSIRKYKTEEYGRPSPSIGVDGRSHDQGYERASVHFSDESNPTLPPRPEEQAYAPPPSAYRFSESITGSHTGQTSATPPPGGPGTNSYFSAHPPMPPSRKNGFPQRVNTISGTNSRRYAPGEPQSAIDSLVRRERTFSMRNPATSSVV